MLKHKIYSKTHIPTNTGTQTNTHICIFHTYIKNLIMEDKPQQKCLGSNAA